MPRLAETPIKNSQLYKQECVRLHGRIKPRQLLVELNKVYRAGVYMGLGREGDVWAIDISGSFLWDPTPQGREFWAKLDRPDDN